MGSHALYTHVSLNIRTSEGTASICVKTGCWFKPLLPPSLCPGRAKHVVKLPMRLVSGRGWGRHGSVSTSIAHCPPPPPPPLPADLHHHQLMCTLPTLLVVLSCSHNHSNSITIINVLLLVYMWQVFGWSRLQINDQQGVEPNSCWNLIITGNDKIQTILKSSAIVAVKILMANVIHGSVTGTWRKNIFKYIHKFIIMTIQNRKNSTRQRS